MSVYFWWEGASTVAAAGGQTVAVGTATETDTVTGVTRVKRVTLGTATETDTAVAIAVGGGETVIAVGTATETDTVTGLGRRKTKALGTATETDTLTSLGRRKTKTLGVPTETDTLTGLGKRKTRTVGTSTETDTAVGVAGKHQRTLVAATETDTVTGLARSKTKALGVGAETDTPTGVGKRKTKTVGTALETDTAVGVAHAIRVALGTAAETDTVTGLGKRKTKALGSRTEADSAPASSGLVYSKNFDLNAQNWVGYVVGTGGVAAWDGTDGSAAPGSMKVTVGTDGFGIFDPASVSAPPIAPDTNYTLTARVKGPSGGAPLRLYLQYVQANLSTITVTYFTEFFPTGAWQTVTVSGISNGITASAHLILRVAATGQTPTFAIDEVRLEGPGVVRRKVRALAPATETDTVTGLTRRKSRTLGVGAETDTATGVTRQHKIALGTGLETDAAVRVYHPVTKVIGPVGETDTATGLARRKSRALGTAAETDAAVGLTRRKMLGIGTATETDTANHLLFDIVVALGTAYETDTALTVTVAWGVFLFIPPVAYLGETRDPTRSDRSPTNRLLRRTEGAPVRYCVMIFDADTDPKVVKTTRPLVRKMHEADYVYLGPREYTLSHDEYLILRDSEFADDLVPA